MLSRLEAEAIDTRWVFRIYAALACLGGLAMLAWGPEWFGARSPQVAAWIRLFASTLLASACCGIAFTQVKDPLERRRGLVWLGSGLLLVWLVLMQQTPELGNARAVRATWFAAAMALAFFYLADTSELRRAGTGLELFGRAPRRQRSRYEQQIRQAAAQEERARLARDLHDSLKQQLFVIQTAAATAQARSGEDPAGAGRALDEIRNAVRDAMTGMEVMTDQLHSGPLGIAGLVEALKRHCEALQFRTGAQVQFHIEGDLPPDDLLAPGMQEALLRVAEEALANVGRHARARQVQVTLFSVPGRLEIRVKDDGAGFDTNQSRRGMGISNMRARAEEFGGDFDLISQPGGGTSIAFSVPYTLPDSPRDHVQSIRVGALFICVGLLFGALAQNAAAVPLCGLGAIQIIRSAIAYRRSKAAR